MHFKILASFHLKTNTILLRRESILNKLESKLIFFPPHMQETVNGIASLKIKITTNSIKNGPLSNPLEIN